MKAWIVFFGSAIIVSICHSVSGCQTSSTSESFDQEQILDVVLREQSWRRTNGFIYDSKVTSQPVMAGSMVRFRLNIVNSGEHDLKFDAIETGCSCFEVKCESQVIPARSTTVVKMIGHHRAPKDGFQDNFGIGIQFKQNSEQVGSIVISGQLHGILSIPPVPALESQGVISLWRVPILATQPVEFENLSVELSPSLRDLSARLELFDGKPVIHISGASASLGLAGIIGEVSVIDSSLKLKVSRRLSFSRRPIARISPLSVRFVRTDPESKIYRANVLVQAVDQTKDGVEKVKNNLLSVECSSPNAKVSVTSSKINEQLVRISLVLDEKQLESEEMEIILNWKVSSQLGNLEMEGWAIVAN